ncbi:MAG: acyl--CoA ligase [Bryobacterales bacterium]|nr:acyl--CoA ligase [Bryobacterales bacterium]
MVFDWLKRVAAEEPEAEALIDGALSLTRRDLVDRSAACGAFLSSQCHLAEGDVVAVSLPNCWQYPVSFFAIASAGAICMPFNPQWRAKEIGWFVRKLGIRLAIASDELRPAWEEGAPGVRVLTADVAGMELAGSQLRPPAGSLPALYLATSGSTGRPKVVPRTHENLLAGRRAVAAALGVQPGTRFLSVVPFHHANGFANGMFLPLASGGTMVTVRKALPSVLAETVRRHGIEIVNMSPILYSLLEDHGVEPAAFASVKVYLSSGAALPPALAHSWRERFGHPIRQLYGSSETGTICIEQAGPTTPGSVGRPVPGVTVRVLDADGNPLPVESRGEIAVHGPAMMPGYVDEPELNATAFAGGYFRMGDLGRLTGAGELVLDGRSKRWINSGGIKIDPVEVENVIGSIPSVEHCKVVPGRDAHGLEVISALIALRPGAQLSRRDIVAHCRHNLAEYKIPRIIEVVETIPVDLAGKTPMEWLLE